MASILSDGLVTKADGQDRKKVLCRSLRKYRVMHQ